MGEPQRVPPTLQEQAQAWAEASKVKEELDEQRQQLENRTNNNATRLEELSKALRARVGSNQPTKIYQTTLGMVVVTVERGVTLLQPE
jgi:chaperonin cofactor prefoldin